MMSMVVNVKDLHLPGNATAPVNDNNLVWRCACVCIVKAYCLIITLLFFYIQNMCGINMDRKSICKTKNEQVFKMNSSCNVFNLYMSLCMQNGIEFTSGELIDGQIFCK